MLLKSAVVQRCLVSALPTLLLKVMMKKAIAGNSSTSACA